MIIIIIIQSLPLIIIIKTTTTTISGNLTSDIPNVSRSLRIDEFVGKNMSRSQTIWDKCWTCSSHPGSS